MYLGLPSPLSGPVSEMSTPSLFGFWEAGFELHGLLRLSRKRVFCASATTRLSFQCHAWL